MYYSTRFGIVKVRIRKINVGKVDRPEGSGYTSTEGKAFPDRSTKQGRLQSVICRCLGRMGEPVTVMKPLESSGDVPARKGVSQGTV